MSMEEIINHFIDRVEKLYKVAPDGNDGFSTEFQKIKMCTASFKQQEGYETNDGSVPENKKKNRYKDILPYDRTRVKLPTDEDSCSDYINATLIQGPDNSSSYIAAQGPLPHTLDDFWRMLWANNVKVIIMVCREIELGKRKCERYWPEDENEVMHFNNITVKLDGNEKNTNSFLERHIVAQKGQDKRKIIQLHYNTWPDHGVPRNRSDILSMVDAARKIQDYRMDSHMPLCVHCSAGCGRTGAVLVIDYFRNLLQHKKLQKGTTIYDVVLQMRRQRPAIVQTKDQYEFVHLVVSNMMTNYLNDHGSSGQLSHLSKSLLSTNYENVTLPAHSPTPQPRKSSGARPQNYENVDITGAPEKPTRDGKPLKKPHPMQAPPPKPVLHSRNAGQTRPVSSFEPLEHTNVSVARTSSNVSNVRKLSAQLEVDSGPPKPALPKAVLRKPAKDIKQINNKPITGTKPEIAPKNPVLSRPIAKSKPSQNLLGPAKTVVEHSSAQGKGGPEFRRLSFLFPSHSSVAKSVENLHAQSDSKPSSDAWHSAGSSNSGTVESIQARKERLWSATTQNENPSNLLGSNLTVAASAMDLRDIEKDSAYAKTRRSFTRTVSSGDGKDKLLSSNVFMKQDRFRYDFQPLRENGSEFLTSPQNERKIAAGEVSKKPLKPPILPRKSSRLKPGVRPALTVKADLQSNALANSSAVRNHAENDAHRRPTSRPTIIDSVIETDSKAVSSSVSSNDQGKAADLKSSSQYVNLSTPETATSPSQRTSTTTAMSDEVAQKSFYSSLQKQLHSSHDHSDDYDMLKRSFKRNSTVTNPDSDETFNRLNRRDARCASETALHNEHVSRPTALMPTSRPYGKPSSGTEYSTVFCTSPPAESSSSSFGATLAPELHGLVGNKEAKNSVQPKPIPPMKPRRTFRKQKDFTMIPRVEEDGSPKESSHAADLYATAHDASAPYYSAPPKEGNAADRNKAHVSDGYAEVNHGRGRAASAGATGKPHVITPSDKPRISNTVLHMSDHSSHAGPPDLPERTPESYLVEDAERADSLQYEDMNEVKTHNVSTDRRISGVTGITGMKAKTKNFFDKTTNVLNTKMNALQNLTSSKTAEDHSHTPSSRQPTFTPAPVMHSNQDISFGKRLRRKPKGSRPVPPQWNHQ